MLHPNNKQCANRVLAEFCQKKLLKCGVKSKLLLTAWQKKVKLEDLKQKDFENECLSFMANAALLFASNRQNRYPLPSGLMNNGHISK